MPPRNEWELQKPDSIQASSEPEFPIASMQDRDILTCMQILFCEAMTILLSYFQCYLLKHILLLFSKHKVTEYNKYYSLNMV